MLCFVAGFAEALQIHQVLMACLFVELPDFVAIHPALTSANLAVVMSPTVDIAANTVPLATRQ